MRRKEMQKKMQKKINAITGLILNTRIALDLTNE